MSNQLQPITHSSESVTESIIKLFRFKFKRYEIWAIMNALRSYAEQNFNNQYWQTSQGATEEVKYLNRLESNANIYRAMMLYKRLSNQQQISRESYSVSMNHNEIHITQMSFVYYLTNNDNMTARLVYGIIHKATI